MLTWTLLDISKAKICLLVHFYLYQQLLQYGPMQSPFWVTWVSFPRMMLHESFIRLIRARLWCQIWTLGFAILCFMLLTEKKKTVWNLQICTINYSIKCNISIHLKIFNMRVPEINSHHTAKYGRSCP